MAALLRNALVFQLGWFACVLGGDPLGAAMGLALVGAHWRWGSRAAGEWRAIALGALLGCAVDSLLHAVGLFRFDGIAAGVPAWLAALWLLFMTTLNHSLRWLQPRLWLAAALGAVGGPLSYLAGVELGAARFGFATGPTLAALAIVWALLLPALLMLMRRLAR